MDITPVTIFQEAKKLKGQIPSILLLDIVCVDLGPPPPERPRHFRLIYRFLDMNGHTRPNLLLNLREGETVTSIATLWDNGTAHEMEIHDLFGIPFTKNYPRYFTQGLTDIPPMRKDFVPHKHGDTLPQEEEGDVYRWYPRFPEDKGAMLFELDMEGERIRKANVISGYFHKGLEKRAEELSYPATVSLLENPWTISGSVASLTYSLGLARAIEELAGMEIPDRASALRMVLLEYARIYTHLYALGHMMIHMGLSSLNRAFFQWQKAMEDVISAYKRNEKSVALVGGALEVDLNWVNQCTDTLGKARHFLRLIESVATGNDDWISRVDHFHMSPSFALAWGYTGPALRATGISYDLRKRFPYYFYRDVDFDVPLGIHGTGYDCYLVRMEEVRQSLEIVSQVLDNLPEGRAHGGGDFSLTEGPEGEVYSFLEGPIGEVGFYIMGRGQGQAYRLKMRSPCYPILFSFDILLRGKTLEEADDMLYSFHLNGREIDR